MHVLFVHSAFPAQFGHVAAALIEHGWACTFISETEPGFERGIRKIRYRPVADPPAPTSYAFARGFERDVRHAAGIYDAVREIVSDDPPDLIVGHATLGPTIFLPELLPDTPVITYVEDFYDPRRSIDRFRPEWPPDEQDLLRARVSSATTLLHLEHASAATTPTHFQRDLLPTAYRGDVHVIHDGIDTNLWRSPPELRERSGSPPIVTYVSRAFDPLRGFDIFMRVAKRITDARDDVIVNVVGTDAEGYGDEMRLIAEPTFREHALAQDRYDIDRIRFLGWLRPEALAQVLSMSDLHIYLTVPIVLSWSMLNAMACGCVVLGSDTAPVREVISDGQNGILRDFDDVDGLASAALDVLADPGSYRDMREAAERTVAERYSTRVTVPSMIELFTNTARG